jgi:hypothetical protein
MNSLKIKKTDEHKHKFVDIPDKKVMLTKGKSDSTSGYDLLKRRKCDCGMIETYDIERIRL